MKVFKDEKGREWELLVNVGTAKKVRSALNVDLFNIQTTEAARVLGDPCLLVDVLYVLCMDQCKSRGVTDEDFGAGVYGDSILHATDALLGEVADFFHEDRRLLLRKHKQKADEATAEVFRQAMAALEALDPKTVIKPVTN